MAQKLESCDWKWFKQMQISGRKSMGGVELRAGVRMSGLASLRCQSYQFVRHVRCVMCGVGVWPSSTNYTMKLDPALELQLEKAFSAVEIGLGRRGDMIYSL